MQDIRAGRRARVTADGTGVVGHAGALLLANLADSLGLTRGFTEATAHLSRRRRRHDPGRVLTQLAVMLADGGDCLSDLATLRDEPQLFGDVASDPTAWRVPGALHSESFRRLARARAGARARAWAAGMAPRTVTLDIDATLIAAHSEKEDARANYKAGFGFHPMCCYLDETGEALSGMLRPGNATANDAADHTTVLDEALAQLPEEYREGHFPGDVTADVTHRVLVRTDSAGSTLGFLQALRRRNCDYSIGLHIDHRVRDAILLVDETRWRPALEADGTVRDGSWGGEITRFCDLPLLSEGDRVICRRERPHPGAQQSLFDREWGYRHQVLVTNGRGEICRLELRHRGHARVEDHIRELKATGGENLPFADVVSNKAWLMLVLVAQDLLAWSRGLLLTGALRSAEVKRLRYTLLHSAGRISTSGRRVTLRIGRSWPWAAELAAAFGRVETIATG
jgi:Transposase DDE domain group 1